MERDVLKRSVDLWSRTRSPPLGTETRLRLRLFSAVGGLAASGRRLRLRLADRWAWAADITAAVTPESHPRPADEPEQPHGQRGETTRAPGTSPTWRDSRAARHGRTQEINPS